MARYGISGRGRSVLAAVTATGAVAGLLLGSGGAAAARETAARAVTAGVPLARLDPAQAKPNQVGALASMPAATAVRPHTTPKTDTAPGGLPFARCSTDAYRGDTRLGPRRLPLPGRSEVGDEVAGYRRGGTLTTAGLLARYWNAAASNGAGGWIYPPDNGYALDRAGRPIEHVVALRPGTKLDRYGSEYGGFLSPLGTPYPRRAIPPSNLDTADPAYTCNYHAYIVVKAFRVDAGPIAAWFGQPGGGVQDQLDASLQPDATTVGRLVADGYLRRLDLH